MKNIYLSLFLTCFIALFLNGFVTAQSFEVLDYNNNNSVIPNNSEITIPTEVDGETVFFYFNVRNASDSEKSLKIKMELQTEQLEGSNHLMCEPTTSGHSGGCGLSWSTTTRTILFSAGETSVTRGDFAFTQGSNPGETIILYTFYDVNNESDAVSITIKYATASYTPDFNTENQFSIYPNPAVNSFIVNNNYGENSYVEIYNVIGEKVGRVNVGDNAQTEIDCSSWKKGYYFCRLFKDGEIKKTLKLTVTN